MNERVPSLAGAVGAATAHAAKPGCCDMPAARVIAPFGAPETTANRTGDTHG